MSHLNRRGIDFIAAEEDALMDFQFAILDELEARGWTQAKLADELGVSRARVSQMLSSEANPTLKLVGRALAVLNLKTEYSSARQPRTAKVRDWQFDIVGAEKFTAMAFQAREADRAWGGAARHANENYTECLLEAA